MSGLNRRVKKTLARLLSEILPSRVMRTKAFFPLWEAKGYHVTPVHFYEPVPDTRTFAPEIFERETPMDGIDLDEAGQLSLLGEMSSAYREEYAEFGYGPSESPADFHFENQAFETVDAEMLYCMVRHAKPKTIIEIGSGFSTRVTAAALRRNKEEDSDYVCRFLCVEPYPKPWLGGVPEVTEIIQSKVETLPLDFFGVLGENDILFIDSTHTVNVYNDVCFEYLDVLPSLRKGVLVHVHDIVLPRIYCEYWFDMKYFWNEQYLLQAFLAFNTAFKVLWAGNFMHLRHPAKLAEAFPSYLKFKNSADPRMREQGHKSFWMRRIA